MANVKGRVARVRHVESGVGGSETGGAIPFEQTFIVEPVGERARGMGKGTMHAVVGRAEEGDEEAQADGLAAGDGIVSTMPVDAVAGNVLGRTMKEKCIDEKSRCSCQPALAWCRIREKGREA